MSPNWPRGYVFDHKAQNPHRFDVVKKDEQLEVLCGEVLAVAVTPAADKAPAKDANKK